jgi:hypothetical protein
MIPFARRRFLQQSATVGVGWSASLMLGRALSAEGPSPSTTRIYLDSRRTLASLDRNLFGSFLERLGRAIYGGIYDPGSKLSDSNGFRQDVIEEVKRFGMPIIRYPGGGQFCFRLPLAGWVGPKKDRPRVLEKGLGFDRNQSIRNQRIYGMVSLGWSYSAYGPESWHGHAGAGCRSSRIL